MSRIDALTEVRCKLFLPPADKMEPGKLYVCVANDGTVEAVSCICPCGCGAECYTPIHSGVPSHWKYEQGPNGPTIKPSIRFTGGCKAHFNITDGKVVWH